MKLQQKLAVTTAGIALSFAAVSHKPAQAADFIFSYSGESVEGSGILTTTDLDPSTNNYTIIGINGERNGVNITSLLSPESYPTFDPPTNDNLLTSSLDLSLNGFAFVVGGSNVNVFKQNGLYYDFTGTSLENEDETQLTSFSVTPKSVPEPVTCAGTVVAGGIGWLMKRKKAAQKAKA